VFSVCEREDIAAKRPTQGKKSPARPISTPLILSALPPIPPQAFEAYVLREGHAGLFQLIFVAIMLTLARHRVPMCLLFQQSDAILPG
jgi:hypothetical protein